jgi:hypothetical protein
MQLIVLSSEQTETGVKLCDTMGLSVNTDDSSIIFDALTKYYPDSLKVVWDMAKFLEPIYALLSENDVRKIKAGDRTFIGKSKVYYYDGYHGQYIGVKHSGNDRTIYQLRTFFPDIKGDLSRREVYYKGIELFKVLLTMNIRVTPMTGLTSYGSLMSKCILSGMYIPNRDNTPDEIGDLLDLAFNHATEWRETFRHGQIDSEVFTYDLTAAYASVIAKIPNFMYAEYTHSMGYKPPKNTYWGILKAHINIDKAISPFTNHGTGETYKPGMLPDIITTDEIACIERWKIGTFEPVEGWYVTLDKMDYPFKYTVERLYELRNKGELENTTAKGLSNVLWGLWCQQIGNEKYGDNFFPPYSSITVTRNKIKLVDFIYENNLQDSLLRVNVDGIQSTKYVDIPTDRRFGEWRYVPDDKPEVIL